MADWTRLLKHQLIARGVELRPPANPATIRNLDAISPINLPGDLTHLLAQFDGFEETSVDKRSEICVWSSIRIIDWLRSTNEHRHYLPIADFFLQSELICLHQDLSIFWEDRKVVVASDLRSFVESLAAGRYDT